MPSAPRDIDATTIATESDRFGRGRQEPEVTTLVIAWYPDDPRRVGELAVAPPKGTTHVMGRGDAEEEPRVRFFRSRPGRLEPTEPLAAPGLSRRQLEVTGHEDGIEVRAVGRCPMRVNEVERETATVRPGDTIRFRQELVLFCCRRPVRLPPLRHFAIPPTASFGSPDSAGIVGESPAAWALRDEIGFAARSGAHVLLLGETGTGKELAARAIHALSGQPSRPFVARNAATLPSGLIDAELFGNVRNYPNPGMPDRPGLVGQADGGFLFLDELGELSVDSHAHLLRVLDADGEYQRLGETATRRSQFRLIAATNRDPTEIKHDLLARLTIRVEIPPLAERREDIPLLLHHLVSQAAKRSPEVAARFLEATDPARPTARADARLVEAVLRRDFPGNTRELDAILWTAISKSDGDVIAWDSDAVASTPPPDGRPGSRPSRPRNEDPGEEEVRAALAREQGNVARAAKGLGLSSRYALYRIMGKLGIAAKSST
jgi:two-component system nitrogen regulation response regulator GlnG/two-component system response regulator HydG